MSTNPHVPKNPNDFLLSLVSFPFNTIEAIGSRVVSAFTSKSKARPKEAPSAPFAEAIPPVTANQQYMIADRVYRTEVCGRNVSFYQYHAAQVIRISCRDLRLLKPIDFTPDTAAGAALVYDIDGAIQWVRKNGLDTNAAKQGATPPAPRTSKATVKAAEANEEPIKPKPTVAAAAPVNIIRAAGNKSRPFTGKIVSFGITQIKSEGRKPYSTYAMTLRSESGSYEKQFIGEHLADLVSEMDLHEGQLVCLQLQGKHQFQVEVGGKMEDRSRNHYAIETL